MVEKMTKYSFILLEEETEGFLLQLQELGVVDITRARKPIDEDSAAMLEKAGAEKRAIAILRKADFREDPDKEAIEAAARTADCNGDYSAEAIEAEARLKDLQTVLYNARKTAKARSPWGEFDKAAIGSLERQGLKIRFYTVPRKSFRESWAGLYPLDTASVFKRSMGTGRENRRIRRTDLSVHK